MKGKALYKWQVVDKHTGVVAGAYSTERGATNAAAHLGAVYSSPKRYEVREMVRSARVQGK